VDSAVGTQLPAFNGEAWSYIALAANRGIVNYAYVGWHTQPAS
jgi:hypothetical protein